MSRYECDGDVCRLVVDESVKDFDELAEPLAEGFTVYGTKSCAYCKRACDVLRRGPYVYKFINLDRYRGGRNQIRDWSGHQTVPVIYHCGNYVGGYTQLLVFLSP